MQEVIEVLKINAKDVMQVVATDVIFSGIPKKNQRMFKTDQEISESGGMLKERDLIKWTGDSQFDPSSPDFVGSLDEDDGTPFDMYKANARFGVTSTYKESLYTTHLDKKSEFYKSREKNAAAMAKAIKNSTEDSEMVQVLEDRGKYVDIDEDEKYSRVIRDESRYKPSKNAYVPPHQRKNVLEKGSPNTPRQTKPNAPKQKKPSPNTPRQTNQSTNVKQSKPSPNTPRQTKPSTIAKEPKQQTTTTAKETDPTIKEKGSNATQNTQDEKKKKVPLKPTSKVFQFNPSASSFQPTPSPNVGLGFQPFGVQQPFYPGVPMYANSYAMMQPMVPQNPPKPSVSPPQPQVIQPMKKPEWKSPVVKPSENENKLYQESMKKEYSNPNRSKPTKWKGQMNQPMHTMKPMSPNLNLMGQIPTGMVPMHQPMYSGQQFMGYQQYQPPQRYQQHPQRNQP